MTLLDCSNYSISDTALAGCTSNNFMHNVNIILIILASILLFGTILFFWRIKKLEVKE